MDVVWIKLTNNRGNVEAHMFGPGGIVRMESGDTTNLFSKDLYIVSVKESVEEILHLIGSVRNGVKVGHEEDKRNN